MAGKLVRLLGLPAVCKNSFTVLKISGDANGEVWHREFDGVSFSTRQWVGSDGMLVEASNGFQLSFRLQAVGDALIYEQGRAKLAFGPLRCPIPLWFAPRITARETGIGDDTVFVEVQVSLPILGLFISYEGKLDVEVPRA